MAELSAIKLPNNTTFTFKDVEARGTTELIVGTQTAATGAWTGNASFSTLEDGRSILYWLPYAGSGNATLNLTLSDNTTTGAIDCYYGGTSRLTTHYGAGNVIRLTYRENVSIAGSSTLYTGWWAEGNYDTNTVATADQYINAKTGAQGIWNVSLVMRDGTGCYQNICTAANGTATNSNRTTATTKLANTNGFEIYSPIWYSVGNYNANTNISGSTILYNNYSLFDARYSFNVTRAANQLVTYKPIFLVGTINSSDGLFYLDSTWWTQTATDTSKVYILVGGCYDSTTDNIRVNLNLENTWYKYDGTRLVPMQSLGGGGESQTVTLTGDVTGSGSTGGSIVTALASSGVTAGSYGLSANATPAAGSSFNVPYVTVDAKGRVTAASTKSVTMPTNASTVNGHSVNKDVPSNAVFTDTTALGSMTGTLSVGHGGTGQTSFTSGSYLVGNGSSALTTKTSSQVLSDIGAVSKSGDTMTGDLYINSTGNTNSIHLHETNDNRGAIYVAGPSGCGDAMLYSNTGGSAELDIRNASQQNRVGMNISSSDDGTIFLRDSSNALATIQKADVDKWNSIIDTIYPVGSLYMTFADIDPAVQLGVGSWFKFWGGNFMMSANTNYPVSTFSYNSTTGTWDATNTGGEATHTLTVDEMPSHRHTVPRGGNSFGTTTHGYTSTGTLFTSSDNRMSAVGGGQPHNNLPPYFAVYMWYRYA